MASTADGMKLVAAEYGGQIHVSRAGQIVPPVVANLAGAGYAGVELVYGGAGQWVVTSKQGVIFQ
jgi:hypothetical protein